MKFSDATVGRDAPDSLSRARESAHEARHVKGVVNRLYYGWRVHAGMFICAMFASGCTSYIFGLFVVPVSGEFAISRANLNLGFIAFLLGNAILSPPVGYLLDKLPARWVICSGGFLFSAGMIVISQTDSLILMLVMILLPISFTACACGTLGANTIIARWFSKQRGKALGTLAVSTSLGGFIFTPMTALLIEHFGWRVALIVVGILANAGIVLAALLLVRDRPSGKEIGFHGEFNDVQTHAVDNADEQVEDRRNDKLWTVTDLLKSKNFWLLTLGISLLFAGDMALVAAQIPHFLESGIELTAAALIASFMTISAIGGKLLVGYLADKLDLRLIFYVVAIAHALLLIVYMIVPPYWMLLSAGLLFGIGIGGVFPVWATLIAWLFGARSFGVIMGIMTIPLNLIAIVALWFVGEAYDVTGSYIPGFSVFLGTILLSMMMVAFIRRPSHA